MAIHVLERTQLVSAKIEDCWDFFSNPRNLSAITPPSLGFEVRSELPDRVYAGLMIKYRVRPLFGLPLTWLTEITQVDEGRYFVDEQRVGPYRLWHHEHWFEMTAGGNVSVRDRVHYVLPLSPLSELFHGILVAPQLAAIFAYREKAVAQRFAQ